MPKTLTKKKVEDEFDVYHNTNDYGDQHHVMVKINGKWTHILFMPFGKSHAITHICSSPNICERVKLA